MTIPTKRSVRWKRRKVTFSPLCLRTGRHLFYEPSTPCAQRESYRMVPGRASCPGIHLCFVQHAPGSATCGTLRPNLYFIQKSSWFQLARSAITRGSTAIALQKGKHLTTRRTQSSSIWAGTHLYSVPVHRCALIVQHARSWRAHLHRCSGACRVMHTHYWAHGIWAMVPY